MILLAVDGGGHRPEDDAARRAVLALLQVLEFDHCEL